jgi:hypothetical protein
MVSYHFNSANLSQAGCRQIASAFTDATGFPISLLATLVGSAVTI